MSMKLSDLAMRITLDLADLKKGLNDANSEMKNFAKKAENSTAQVSAGLAKLKSGLKIAGAIGAVGFAIGAAAKQIGDFTIAALRMADSIGDTAAALGMGVESFQAMEYAAVKGSMTAEDFKNAIIFMNNEVGKALDGDKGARQKFEDLGISMEELASMTPEQSFVRLIGALNQVDNAQLRASKTAEIFGKRNAQMNAIIADGADRFEESAAEATKYGLVLSENLVKAAGKTIDELDLMSKALGNNVKTAFINFFEPAVQMAISVMETLNSKFAEFNMNAAEASELGDAALDARITQLQEQRASLEERIKNSSNRDNGGRVNVGRSQAIKDLRETNDLIAKAMKERADRQEKAAADERQRANEAAALLAEQERKAAAEAAEEKAKKDKENAAREAKARQDAAAAAAQAIIDRNKTEREKYEEGVKNAQELFDQRLLTEEQFNREVAALGNQYADTLRKQYDDNLKRTEEFIKDFQDEMNAYRQIWSDTEEGEKNEFIARIEERIKAFKELGATEERLAALRAQYDEDYIAQFGSATQQLLLEWTKLTDQLEEATAGWIESSADMLTDFVMTGKMDFKAFANSIIADLVRIAIKSTILRALGSFGFDFGGLPAGTGSGGAASVSSILRGGKAGGGAIQPGVPTLVGERGPELVVPSAPARVLNNHTLSQMGGNNVKVEVINRGTPQQATASNVRLDPKGMVVQVIMEDLQRGGPIASGMNNIYGLRRRV